MPDNLKWVHAISSRKAADGQEAEVFNAINKIAARQVVTVKHC